MQCSSVKIQPSQSIMLHVKLYNHITRPNLIIISVCRIANDVYYTSSRFRNLSNILDDYDGWGAV